jgi:hypothetical protein
MNEVSLLVHSLRLLEGEEFSKLYDLEDCTKVERDKGFFFFFFFYFILFNFFKISFWVLPTKARILLCSDL